MKTLYMLLVVGLAACSTQQETTFDLIISNTNLIDGTGSPIQQNVNVYLKDGSIERIDREYIIQSENIIDGTDKYLIPGLFDCHAHTGKFKVDFPRFAHYGVTSILVPGGSTCTNEYFAAMRAMAVQDSIPSPRVFHTSQHFTMEGRHPAKTYASSNWRDGESIFFLKDTVHIEELVKQVVEQPIVGIKLTIEDGPTPPMVERMPQTFINKVNKEALKNGTKVFAHVSDNEELGMALNAGITDFLHYTGVDLDFERDKELIDKIYGREISWVTTLMLDKRMLYPKHPEWIEDVGLDKIFDKEDLEMMSDPDFMLRADGFLNYFREFYNWENPTLKQVIEFQVEDIRTLYENGVNMVVGTDTGNDLIFPGYSVHEEMQLLEMGGMEPLEILKMGTSNAAKMLNVDDSLGTIEAGKYADLILLDRNPLESISNTLSINTVIKNGKIQKRLNQ